MIRIQALKTFSRAKKYPRSTILARENLSTELFVLLKGEVGVYANYRRQNEELLATLGPGELLEEKALLLDKSCSTTAVALTDVIALPINRLNASSFFAEEPEMTLEIMRTLCARLDAVEAAYERLAGSPWSHKNQSPSLPYPAAAVAADVLHPESPAAPAPAAIAPSGLVTGDARCLPMHPELFPPEHGSYRLALPTDDRTYLLDKSFHCPYCKTRFTAQQVRVSKLIELKTDPDMRRRYQSIEPMYYDVVTCPNCMYSALDEQFSAPENPKADLRALQVLMPRYRSLFTGPKSADSVFAGYYLALLCAPLCWSKHQWSTAKLYLKLSRVYADGGDEALERRTAAQAKHAYMYLYTNEMNSPSQEQQLTVILGELSLKLGDLKSARDFFFQAKTNREGSPLLREHADNRIYDIKMAEAAKA